MRFNSEKCGGDCQKVILEQYKIYVEMADRISARRMLANTFFLGIHTAFIAVFALLIKEKVDLSAIVGLALLFGVIVLCGLWWAIIRSYGQLNTGKYKVVHEIEQLLPLAPYDAEWEMLEKGKNWKVYLPLTHIENYVPLCFAVTYIALAFGVIMSHA